MAEIEVDRDWKRALSLIPTRIPESHKGTYGKVLIVAGSRGMCGAAFLSAFSCYRSGAGLVKILSHADNRIPLQMLLPEAIVDTYDETTELVCLAERELTWADAVIIGPGLGKSLLSQALLRAIADGLQKLNGGHPKTCHPDFMLLDADALNMISDGVLDRQTEFSGLDTFSHLSGMYVVITPHPMEMKRLLRHDGIEKETSEINEDALTIAATFATKHNVTTVLKSAGTVVAMPNHATETGIDGEKSEVDLSFLVYGTVFQCPLVSPALSKGGSGDVLSGVITGIYMLLRAEAKATSVDKVSKDRDGTEKTGTLLLDVIMAFQAAKAGVILHVLAGGEAAKVHGTHGVLARETADEIPLVIEQAIEGKYSVRPVKVSDAELQRDINFLD